MNKFKHMKKILKQCIRQLDESSSLFVINPDKDFTRKRKHLFGNTLMNVLLLEGGSPKDELYKLFGYNLDTPTVSSFIRTRDKIKSDTFHTLFNLFNDRTRKPKLYKGYRLLAVDGSTLPITSEIKDNKTTIRKANNSDKQFSAFHLNTSYDILEYTYDDVILQGQAVQDEREALNKIVERYKGAKAIFAINEDVNELRSLGDVFVAESKNAKKLQKKAKTGKRKKRYGKSIKNRCPGYFQSQAKRKFRIYVEVPNDYKASQYDHTSDEYIKKSLSQRMYKLQDGTMVQRDLYSSFLLYCIDLTTNKIDKNKCIHEFEKQYKNQNETIEYIQMNQIKVMNSGIRVN